MKSLKVQKNENHLYFANAWGDGRLPIIFRPNPGNKSARVLKFICGDNRFYFCNTSPVVTRTAAERAEIDVRHFTQVIKRLRPYDLILVCGRQAEKAVKDRIKDFQHLSKPLFYIPHPASRAFKNLHMMYIKSIIDNISPLNVFAEYDLIAG